MSAWKSDPVAKAIEKKRNEIQQILGVDIFARPALTEYLVCELCELEPTPPRHRVDGLHTSGARVEIKYCNPKSDPFKFSWSIKGKHEQTDIFVLVGRRNTTSNYFEDRDELLFFAVPQVYAAVRDSVTFTIAPRRETIQHQIMRALKVAPEDLKLVLDEMCKEAIRSRKNGERFMGPIPNELIDELKARKLVSELVPGFLSGRPAPPSE